MTNSDFCDSIYGIQTKGGVLMEEKTGLTIKGILIRLILIIIFIILLIWLFPMPDLEPLNSQIFLDNIDRMKDVAKSYYTVERLPKNVNDSEKMTLGEMIENHLILPLVDSNGNYCDEDDSYVQITKQEDEYVIKVNLSCTDNKDYVIEHYGCYDICGNDCCSSNTCDTSNSTTTINTSTAAGKKTTIKTTAKKTTTSKKATTSASKITTTKSNKIYEYEYVKSYCTEEFDKYVCPSDYTLVGENCIKNNSETVVIPADEEITYVYSTDTKDAEVIVDSSTSTTPAVCTESYKTSTISAGYKKTTYSAQKTTTTQTVTADKTYSYDVKGAIATTKTTTASYEVVQNYDVISADMIANGYKWTYKSTITSRDSSLAYVGDNEKIVLVDSWQELTCDTCFTTVTVYKYYRYEKTATSYSYSCDAYDGYTLYDGNKCRKATTQTKKCPSGYTDTGSSCKKTETTYSCSSYGSDYEYDSSTKTCKKTNVTYTCPSGTTATSDPKYCNKSVTTYTCPSGTEQDGNTCIKYDYYCPDNTSDKTYTLNGSKCTVKTKVKECSCPDGSVESEDGESCVVQSSTTKYSCDKYDGYTLEGDKCVKTTVTEKLVYSCDNYEGSILDGTNCVKTVETTDTIKAEKEYTTSCENKYMWSTSTSVDGWTYTGNKRPIN